MTKEVLESWPMLAGSRFLAKSGSGSKSKNQTWQVYMDPKLAKNQTQRFYMDPEPIGFHASKLTQELNLVGLKDFFTRSNS